MVRNRIPGGREREVSRKFTRIDRHPSRPVYTFRLTTGDVVVIRQTSHNRHVVYEVEAPPGTIVERVAGAA